MWLFHLSCEAGCEKSVMESQLLLRQWRKMPCRCCAYHRETSHFTALANCCQQGVLLGFCVVWFFSPYAFFAGENNFSSFCVWKFLDFDPCLRMEQLRVSSWMRKGSKQGISEGWLWRVSLQTFLKDTEKLFLIRLVWSHRSQRR